MCEVEGQDRKKQPTLLEQNFTEFFKSTDATEFLVISTDKVVLITPPRFN